MIAGSESGNDFLGRLARRSLGSMDDIRPRLASPFEPAQGTDVAMPETDDARAARPAPEPRAARDDSHVARRVSEATPRVPTPAQGAVQSAAREDSSAHDRDADRGDQTATAVPDSISSAREQSPPHESPRAPLQQAHAATSASVATPALVERWREIAAPSRAETLNRPDGEAEGRDGPPSEPRDRIVAVPVPMPGQREREQAPIVTRLATVHPAAETKAGAGLAPASASPSSTEATAPPVVNVTIGRLEVRAVSAPARTREPQAPRRPGLELGEYLRKRRRGEER